MASSVAPDPTSVAQEVAAAQSTATSTTGNPHDPQSQSSVQPGEIGTFGTLVVDTGSDHDSAYGDDYESFTTSIKSTALDYKFEHGRRYHAYEESKYPLPNDSDEAKRLELQHQCWQLCMHGRLALAPIPETVKTALDIGCGTGQWVIEFGEVYPDCRVVGADLSPIQPTLVPPNVEFIVDDITSPWVYDYKFDYIHSRAITVGIRDWTTLVDEIWKNLEPGGIVEFQEYHAPLLCDDDTMVTLCPNFADWNAKIGESAALAGTRLDAILGVPAILQARGFINAGTASTKWPLGPWARGKREKKIGEFFQKDIADSLEGISMRLFTRFLGMTKEEVATLTTRAVEEIYSGKMHTYMAIDFLWAQKPFDAV